MKTKFLFFSFLPLSVFAQQSIHEKSKALVAKMSLEEKVHLVVGMGMKLPPGITLPDGSKTGPVVGQTADKVEGAAGTTFAISRLHVPSMVVADGPAGVRISPIRKNDPHTYYATAFPIGTLLASTWDTATVKKVGAAMGNELKEYGIDILLAPALNIHRNPLGGRNFEYYSEDPLVAGRIAAAYVNGIQSNGVGTSIKHYVANNQETNRNTVNTIVSERALREIYLRGFELTVKEARPWTVMSSYNKVNGTYTSESYDLLTTILRKEWKYKGFVMTDWFGGKDAVAQMRAGNDLLMPGTPKQIETIEEAVKNKSLPEEVLNENAARILDIIQESPAYHNYGYSNKPDLKAHAQVARAAAADGMVLLKNESNTLPAKASQKVALFGVTAYEMITGGTGSGDVNKAYAVSLPEGLTKAGFTIDEALQKEHLSYLEKAKAAQPKKRMFFEPMIPITEISIAENEIEQKANDCGIAFITIGRSSGEFFDRKLENDFYLSKEEKQLLSEVSKAFHAKGKKVVVILNIGGVIETASWQDDADAILLAWQPGQEAGNAVADVISGKVNPSGKLATTFPVDYKDVPSAKNFPGKELPSDSKVDFAIVKNVPAEVTYEEGIYVGYRYYNTFNVPVAYPFGYGLSYTSFKYSNLQLSSKSFNGKLTATVTVTNTGKSAGKEVVQLYISAPHQTIDKPEEELKAFAKTGLLQPGRSQTIRFTIDGKLLASFHTDASAWIADAGTYTVKAASNANTVLQKADFSVAKDIIVEKVNKVLVPQVSINELKK